MNRVGRPADDIRAALALALALPAVTLAVLRPPEFVGVGRIALGSFAAAAALLFAWRPPVAGKGTGRAAALLLPVALACVATAPCRARALDEAAQFEVLVLLGLLGFAAARDARSWRLVPTLLLVLASGAAVQAILQTHWLYPGQAEILRAGGTPVDDNLILRLEAGRPSGPFILPSSLGGFLALALPGTLVLARHAASRWSRAFLVVAVILQVYALVRTRSLGGLAAAAGGLLLALPAMTVRRRTAGSLLVALTALALAGWFLHLRRAEIGQGPGGDPLLLRAGNWRAAAQMIGDRPLLGVGPGSFGTAYPRYMRAGMNETRFAHNSYLQVASCWGIWALAPLGVMLLGMYRKVGARFSVGGAPGRDEGVRLAVAAGAAGFLFHNLVDFTFYLPGIAAPAALLIGMTLGDGERPTVAAGWRRQGQRLAATSAAVLIGWNTLVSGRADASMEAARRTAEAGDVMIAASAARHAAAARPGSPEPWAFLAQLVLVHHMDDDLLRREGLEAAVRAARLDPESAILHHTLALYHASAGERAPAYLEEHRAHLLYPLKSEYRTPAVPVGEP